MAEQEAQEKENKTSGSQPGKINIIYYTDPLCCWSWAFERHWRRFLKEWKGKVAWQYCMGGLLPDWKNYNDAINSVTRPAQMGPVWMHAGKVANVTINHRIWMDDPPASSYPACIAVKCAELQSKVAGDRYLAFLRQACMLQGLNIAKKEVLIKVATDMVTEFPGLMDIARFKKDITDARGLEAFRKDLQQAQYHRINRFPSLVIRKDEQPAVLLTGYIPYEVLENTLAS